MIIRFRVEVEVHHLSGKFASKSDIADAIREELEGAAYGASVSGYDADGNSEYEVTSADVEEM